MFGPTLVSVPNVGTNMLLKTLEITWVVLTGIYVKAKALS